MSFKSNCLLLDFWTQNYKTLSQYGNTSITTGRSAYRAKPHAFRANPRFQQSFFTCLRVSSPQHNHPNLDQQLLSKKNTNVEIKKNNQHSVTITRKPNPSSATLLSNRCLQPPSLIVPWCCLCIAQLGDSTPPQVTSDHWPELIAVAKFLQKFILLLIWKTAWYPHEMKYSLHKAVAEGNQLHV